MTHLERLREIDRRYRIFSELNPSLSEEDLGEANLLFSAKDNLCTRDMQTRAGSAILDGYRPPFDATAIRRLREAGGILVGKTNMDEFGFGSFNTNSAYGVPRNPFDPERSCGGSSGGSAAAAALLEGHLALGESTGGSISCPAAYCGVVGLTPTYGRVSRYGLVDYANSLDKIGLLSRSGAQVAEYLQVISGPDQQDPTSQVQPALQGGDVRSLAVPRGALEGLDEKILDSFQGSVDRLRSLGMEVHWVEMPSLRFSLPAYYLLASCEVSTNLARYCGMRYGVQGDDISQHYNDYFSQVRSAHLGKEAKRRVLLGTFSRMVGFRDRYYMKALQVRQVVQDDYARVFRDHDLVLTPTMPMVAPRFDEVEEMRPLDMYKADCLTVPANLTGLPHVSLPSDYLDGMPVGIHMVAPRWHESSLVDAMLRWEEAFTYREPEVSL
ncbi:MAG: amidase family protein [Methanomassiliicoccales archaeon]